MMDWTDRHCRYFHRLLSPHARLYTEMVTSPALIHGDRERLLGFDVAEHPVALQLGGSDPREAAQRAGVAPFKVQEMTQTVKGIPPGTLARWMRLLAHADLALKSSKRPAQAILEAMILEMCA